MAMNDTKSKLQAKGATVIDGKSADIVADNIEAFKVLLSAPELRNRVAELFPKAFADDGELQIDALLQEMGHYADKVEDHESYPISWRGKAEAEKHAQSMTTATLRPCIEESVGKDGKDGAFDSQNLYIEGDNLEVLKVLERSYAGQIKMIYIDPPYNTGNDFIYNDKYADGIQTYLEYTGQKDDKGNDKSTKKETSGASHSNWLSMMYPRLEYAKRLLSDDGVIFISIDDNEQANLKRLCDLVFGDSNFICTLNWNTKKAAQGMTTANMIVNNHEYILCYSKYNNKFKFWGLERDENNGFSNPDNDERGPWKRQYLQRLGQGLPKRTIIDPITKNTFTFETPYTQEKLDQWVKENRIIFPKTRNNYPARKEFLLEYKNRQQCVTSLGLYPTKTTTEKLYKLFNGKKVFTNPKPDTLIKFIIEQSCSKKAIILDFFSGSSTTADSVMQLNVNDNNNRKYIMVQFPENIQPVEDTLKGKTNNDAIEYCDTIYPKNLIKNETGEIVKRLRPYNICDIGKERIRLAGKAIKQEYPDANIDIGFKVFKLDSSNLKKWDDKAAEDVNEVSNRLLGAQDMMVSGRSHLDVVYEYMLKYGLTLDWQVECVKVHNKDVYVVAGGMFMVCLDYDLDIEWAKELVQLKKKLAPVDWRVLVADESFGNETKTRDNNAQNIFHTLCDAGLAPVNFIIA